MFLASPRAYVNTPQQIRRTRMLRSSTLPTRHVGSPRSWTVHVASPSQLFDVTERDSTRLLVGHKRCRDQHSADKGGYYTAPSTPVHNADVGVGGNFSVASSPGPLVDGTYLAAAYRPPLGGAPLHEVLLHGSEDVQDDVISSPFAHEGTLKRRWGVQQQQQEQQQQQQQEQPQQQQQQQDDAAPSQLRLL